ncbi:enoyl-CoA hydratase [Candidatus Poriferisodalis sp.]|uniref:enoyl-CoA hydratase n=1 Tax=Candidatus Poriferisodalis sp. TaxID=3101277 RepID=UPI003AF94626
MSGNQTNDTVLYEVDDGVAIVTLNRPERLNAWTGELGTGYFDALDRAAADSDVRAVVVTGAGRGFCAGADMDSLQGISSGQGEGTGGGDAPRLRAERHDYALTIPKPVVAAINGACAGLGFVHAMMCDVRFAAEGAKFTSAFARRGLIAEHGVAWMLPRVVGPSHALDILMSGRVFLAPEAKEMGVVSKVVPAADLLSTAVSYARDLGRYSAPWSMAQIKRQVWGQLDQASNEALEESNALMRESLRRTDFKEGVQSFVEQRDPNFEPVVADS